MMLTHKRTCPCP